MARWQDELVRRAREQLPAPLFRYISQGARDGITTGEAEQAWAAHRFAPHVLRDVSTLDPAVSLLGQPFSSPIAVAPTTL